MFRRLLDRVREDQEVVDVGDYSDALLPKDAENASEHLYVNEGGRGTSLGKNRIAIGHPRDLESKFPASRLAHFHLVICIFQVHESCVTILRGELGSVLDLVEFEMGNVATEVGVAEIEDYPPSPVWFFECKNWVHYIDFSLFDVSEAEGFLNPTLQGNLLFCCVTYYSDSPCNFSEVKVCSFEYNP